MGEVKKSVKGSRSAAGRTVRAVRRSLDRQEARYKPAAQNGADGRKSYTAGTTAAAEKGAIEIKPRI